jgi:cell fate regulator YaaT (PSP1 superfamily)
MRAENAQRPEDAPQGGGCGGCSFKGMSTAVDDTFVGVRFGDETNLTLCRTGGSIYGRGDTVVIDLEAGPAYGRVERSPMPVFKPCQKTSARRIIRRASEEDDVAQERKLKNEFLAKQFCREKAKSLKLEMKVSKVEFSLNGRRATFYFTANGRVDFRQLVRDLAQRFSTRVKMVQVGARDEAGLLGGIGICGRTLCCSTWLKDFKPISIQMAKRQNLSLNPSKISGQCGRLLCCLAYEDKVYQRKKKSGNRLPAAAEDPPPGPLAGKAAEGGPRSRNPIQRGPAGAGNGAESPGRNPRGASR